jgi:hypothetical protein
LKTREVAFPKTCDQELSILASELYGKVASRVESRYVPKPAELLRLAERRPDSASNTNYLARVIYGSGCRHPHGGHPDSPGSELDTIRHHSNEGSNMPKVFRGVVKRHRLQQGGRTASPEPRSGMTRE